MNGVEGEWKLTDEQKAAMEEFKETLKHATIPVVQQYLIGTHPDLFPNTGQSMQLIATHWGAVRGPVEPEETAEEEAAEQPPPATT